MTQIVKHISWRRINVLVLLIVFIFFTKKSNAQVCATPGQDGATNSAVSINTYYPPLGNVSVIVGAKSVILGSVPPVDGYGNSFGTTYISAGDLLMIIQMQDADINFTNSPLYGGGNNSAGPDGLGGTGFISLNSAGNLSS